MVRPAVPHRLSAVLVAGLLVLLGGAAWFAPPAPAEDRTVDVRGDGYAPAETTVRVGETVTWAWATNGHSVTHEPEGDQDQAFDSHPDCTPFVGRLECGQEGDTFAHTFERPGTYPYASRMNENVRGTVVVQPQPTPTKQETPSPSEADPASEPRPERSSPSPAPSTDRSGAGASDEDDGQADSAASRRVSGESVLSGGDAGTSDAQTPEVATASPSDEASDPGSTTEEPTFDDFPEPTSPEPATDDVAGEVAIGGGDDASGARRVWGAVGAATLLGTLGALVRVVLLREPWSATP